MTFGYFLPALNARPVCSATVRNGMAAKPRFRQRNHISIPHYLRAIERGVPNHQLRLTRISAAYAALPKSRV